MLKSPPNTARVSILRSLFPSAHFIHIARNPVRIFQPYWKLLKVIPAWVRLSPALAPSDRIARTAENFRRMYDAYFKNVRDLPASQLFELRLEDLIRNPIGLLQEAYRQLGLCGFEAARPWMKRVAAAGAAPRQTAYPPMDPVDWKVLQEACRPYADRWDYVLG